MEKAKSVIEERISFCQSRIDMMSPTVPVRLEWENMQTKWLILKSLIETGDKSQKTLDRIKLVMPQTFGAYLDLNIKQLDAVRKDLDKERKGHIALIRTDENGNVDKVNVQQDQHMIDIYEKMENAIMPVVNEIVAAISEIKNYYFEDQQQKKLN